MGELGNFYCVPNSCSRITWRPYSKVLRYRYPDEEWVELEYDHYQTADTSVGCITWLKRQTVYVAVSTVHYPRSPLIPNQYTSYSYNPPWGGELVSVSHAGNIFTVEFTNVTYTQERGYGYYEEPDPITELAYDWRWFVIAYNDAGELVQPPGNGVSDERASEIIHNQRVCQTPQCTFTVFKNKQIIFERTTEECPEIEKLGCQLSDTFNELTVEKLPFLERVEIRNQEIKTIYVSPLDAPLIDTSSLPEHCYHVYKTVISAPPVLSEYVPIPGVINPYQFMGEICSSEECPPPEFEVLCDCDCRECPDGTCATECDGHICCNDIATGLLIESIPIAEYCEST